MSIRKLIQTSGTGNTRWILSALLFLISTLNVSCGGRSDSLPPPPPPLGETWNTDDLVLFVTYGSAPDELNCSLFKNASDNEKIQGLSLAIAVTSVLNPGVAWRAENASLKKGDLFPTTSEPKLGAKYDAANDQTHIVCGLPAGSDPVSGSGEVLSFKLKRDLPYLKGDLDTVSFTLMSGRTYCMSSLGQFATDTENVYSWNITPTVEVEGI
jgi:hypothetical protein